MARLKVANLRDNPLDALDDTVWGVDHPDQVAGPEDHGHITQVLPKVGNGFLIPMGEFGPHHCRRNPQNASSPERKVHR